MAMYNLAGKMAFLNRGGGGHPGFGAVATVGSADNFFIYRRRLQNMLHDYLTI